MTAVSASAQKVSSSNAFANMKGGLTAIKGTTELTGMIATILTRK
jgi:hypothetical protein